ncbi:MAG: hypothetical protein BJ554DRAFT_5964, partial [Olpidium bornovanus]
DFQEKSAPESLHIRGYDLHSLGAKTPPLSHDATPRAAEPFQPDQASLPAASDARSGRTAAPPEGTAAATPARRGAGEPQPEPQPDATPSGAPPVAEKYLRKVVTLEFERNRLHHELGQLRRTLSAAQAQRAKHEACESKAAALQAMLADKEREAVEREEQVRLERKRAGDSLAELQTALTRRETEAAALTEQCEWLRKENARLLERERRLQGQVSRQTSTTDLSVLGRAKSSDSLRQEVEIAVTKEQNEVLRKENARLLELEQRLEKQLVRYEEAAAAAAAATSGATPSRQGPTVQACETGTQTAPVSGEAHDATAGLSDSPGVAADFLAAHIEPRDPLLTVAARAASIETPATVSTATQTQTVDTALRVPLDSPLMISAVTQTEPLNFPGALPPAEQVPNAEQAPVTFSSATQTDALDSGLDEATKRFPMISSMVRTETPDPPLTVSTATQATSIEAPAVVSTATQATSIEVPAVVSPAVLTENLDPALSASLEASQTISSMTQTETVDPLLMVSSAAQDTRVESPATISSAMQTVALDPTLRMTSDVLPMISPKAQTTNTELRSRQAVHHPSIAYIPSVPSCEKCAQASAEGLRGSLATAAAEDDNARIRDLEASLLEANRRLREAEASAARRGERLLRFEQRLHEEADRRRKLDAQVRDELSHRCLAEEKAAELAEAVKRSTEELRAEERRAETRDAESSGRERELRAELKKVKDALQFERERERERLERMRERDRERDVIERDREQVERERDRVERDRLKAEKAREDAEVHHLVAVAEDEARAWRSMEAAAQEEIHELQLEVGRLRAALAAQDAATTVDQDSIETQVPEGRAHVRPAGEPESVSAFLAETLERMKADVKHCERRAEEEELKARKLQELVDSLKAELDSVKVDCRRWKVAAEAVAERPAADCGGQRDRRPEGFSTTAIKVLNDVIAGNLRAVNCGHDGRSAENAVTANPAEAFLGTLRMLDPDRTPATQEAVAGLAKHVDAMIEQAKKLRDDNARLAAEAREACEMKQAQVEAWHRRHAELKEQMSRAEKKLGAWEAAGAAYERMWQIILAKSEQQQGPGGWDPPDAEPLAPEPAASPLDRFVYRPPGPARPYPPELDDAPPATGIGERPDGSSRDGLHREQQQERTARCDPRWRHPFPFWEQFRHLLATSQAAQHTLSRMREQMLRAQESAGQQLEKAALVQTGLERAEAEKRRAEQRLKEFADLLEKVSAERDDLRLKLRRVGVGFKALVLANNALDVSSEA